MKQRKQDRAGPSPSRGGRAARPAGWFAVVTGVALVIRIIYVLMSRANDPLFFSPQMDALYHQQWATAIAHGIRFVDDAYFRAPLYPFLLGLIYRVFGVSLVAARVVQAVIGSASCGLLYLLARRLFNERTARISGFVMACYPLAIYFDGELLIANLLVFLLLLGFVLLLRSRALDRQWYLPGLAFGLAAIARPNVLAFIVVLFAWFIYEYAGANPRSKTQNPRSSPQVNPQSTGQGATWKRLLQFYAAVVIVIAPVTIRNYVASGKLVLIAWQGGTNFYIGNNPQADGITAIVPGTRSDWWGGYYDTKRLAEQAEGRPLKDAEVDNYWLRQGLRYWQGHPIDALGKLVRKCYLWLSGYEVSNNRDTYFFTRYTFLKLLLFNLPGFRFPFGLLLPLGLAGVYLARARRRQLAPIYVFLLSYMASFVVFFVTDRYRMPFVILMIPFAVLAIEGAFDRKPSAVPGTAVSGVRTGRREWITALVIFAGAYLICNFNLAGITETKASQNYFMVANAQNELLANQSRPDRQIMDRVVTNINLALARDSAMNILSLGATVSGELGQTARAEQLARAAIRLWPNLADAWGLAGNVHANLNQPDSAQRYFEHALQLDPYSLPALNNLGLTALSRKDYAQARSYFERALKIDATYTLALFHLGLVDYYQGDKASAHELWQRVLQLEPDNIKARQALEQLR